MTISISIAAFLKSITANENDIRNDNDIDVDDDIDNDIDNEKRVDDDNGNAINIGIMLSITYDDDIDKR